MTRRRSACGTCARTSSPRRAWSRRSTASTSTWRAGEILGLVGESGSGKTVTGFSILGLIDPPGRIVERQLDPLQGRGADRRAAPERLRAIRGAEIAMIFQDPMMTLNPVLRVDTQMIESDPARTRR